MAVLVLSGVLAARGCAYQGWQSESRVCFTLHPSVPRSHGSVSARSQATSSAGWVGVVSVTVGSFGVVRPYT